MTTIPQIRVRLHELAIEHKLPELDELALALWRRPAVRRAPTSSPRITPEMATAIRARAMDDTIPLSTIAAEFGVNIGRLSEVLAGKRS